MWQPDRALVRDTRVMVEHPSDVDAPPAGGDSAEPLRHDFDELYRRDFAAVVALVYGISGSRWAAEELAQEAFAAAHRNWATVGDYANPGAWVRTVAMNRARSAWRRKSAEARAMLRLGTRRTLPAELPPPAHEFWAAVRDLPRLQAQVVALRYVEDRSLDDIAQVLGIATGTVKSQLFRARQSLAVTLGVPDPTEDGDEPC
jgi:RNA polymerase sigma-70 factor (ECF subfamily)